MKSRIINLIGKHLSRISMTLACLLIISTAFAQQSGIVEGRLVNGTDAAIVPGGVQLEVVALSDAMGIIRTTMTDSAGKFRIENLPVQSMLMLRAIYKGANYNKQVGFNDSGHAHMELEVYEATTSMKDIQVEEYQMVFQAIGNHLQSLDTVVFNNETDPAVTFMNPEGNYRFSKAPAIEMLPQIRIKAPGSSMPVVQSVLESPDGQSYYSLYPFRPGKTTVDVFQVLPYENLEYTYVKKFYHPVPSIEIGVIPMDMELSGPDLTRVQTDPDRNIAVYRSGPIAAGSEFEWIFTGGTPVVEEAVSPAASGSRIQSLPNMIGRNAAVIASLLLLGLVLVLWYALNRSGGTPTDPTSGS